MLIDIDDAKTHLVKIIKKVLKGEEIIITSAGEKLVKLVPYTYDMKPRKGGQLRGMLDVKDDFDDPIPDAILKKFYDD